MSLVSIHSISTININIITISINIITININIITITININFNISTISIIMIVLLYMASHTLSK